MTQRTDRLKRLGAPLAWLMLLGLAGCSGPVPRAAPEPSRPEQWFLAQASGIRQGRFNLGHFYDPEARVDLTAFGAGTVYGRTEAIETLGLVFPPGDDAPIEGGGRDVYLTEAGALLEDRHLGRSLDQPHELLAIDRMGPHGIAEQAFARSELGWRSQRRNDRRILPPHITANAWASAWSAGDAEAIAALYAGDAVLEDSLGDVRASGSGSIAGLVRAAPGPAGLPGFTIRRLPDLGGPAVYVIGDPTGGEGRDEPITTLAVLGSADGGHGCPGRVAAVLDLDALTGLIRHEARYHHATDQQRCAGALPAGWWDFAPLPEPLAMEQTGTLSLGGQDVAMFNADPGLDAMVRWAHGQYAAAGLESPKLTRVAFVGSTSDLCEGISGLAAGGEVTLCFLRSIVCANPECTRWSPQSRWTTLHEFGHVWISATVQPAVAERFTEQAGLPTWADSRQPWARRGAELAASVLAWGLMGEDATVGRAFRDRSCDELAALYRTLTGVDAPAVEVCVPTESGPGDG